MNENSIFDDSIHKKSVIFKKSSIGGSVKNKKFKLRQLGGDFNPEEFLKSQ